MYLYNVFIPVTARGEHSGKLTSGEDSHHAMDKDRNFSQKRPKVKFYFSVLKIKKYKIVRISPPVGQCWTEINEAGDTGAAWLRLRLRGMV